MKYRPINLVMVKSLLVVGVAVLFSFGTWNGTLGETSSALPAFEEQLTQAGKNREVALLKVANGYGAGEGVARDLRSAAYWLRRWQGVSGGFKGLGAGRLPPPGLTLQDYRKAIIWMKTAEAEKIAVIQYMLAGVYETGVQPLGIDQQSDEALRRYEMAARLGYAPAQLYLARHGDRGAWYEKAAAQGVADAQYHLGLYEKAARKGHPEAAFKQMLHFIREKDTLEAVYWLIQWEQRHGGFFPGDEAVGLEREEVLESLKWLIETAEQGVAGAQQVLAGVYDQGNASFGIQKDQERAVELLKKAAEQGLSRAQFQLAARYVAGDGVEEDLQQAASWYREAAESGMAPAQLTLGMLYEGGQLGEAGEVSGKSEESEKSKEREENGKNLALATFWYQKAADQGMPNAKLQLGQIYRKTQAAEDAALDSLYWIRSAADAGMAKAQFLLGNLYLQGGEVIQKNPSEAVTWYRKASERGYGDAQLRLGMAYQNGVGVEKDPRRARYWLNKAAAQGKFASRKQAAQAQSRKLLIALIQKGQLGGDYTDFKALRQDAREGVLEAQYLLADLYRRSANVGGTFMWLTRAARSGHQKSQGMLGMLYAREGNFQNYQEAYRWLTLATASGTRGREALKKRLAEIQKEMSAEALDQAVKLLKTDSKSERKSEQKQQ